jgi:putative ABC transport system substrate-binding protein
MIPRGRAGAHTRRRFLLGGTAVAAFPLGMVAGPLLGSAQAPPRMFRIGVLGGSSPTSAEASHIWKEFFQGLRDLGWVEGQNIAVEGRYYGDRLDRLPALATELARVPVDVIVAAAPPAPEAARSATSTIPIVMANHPDPVAARLAASLARPGGNVTGLSLLSREMRIKHLQLLKELLPRLTRVAFLRHPDIPLDVSDLVVTARSLALAMHVIEAPTPGSIASAFAEATRQRAGAMSGFVGSMFFAHRAQIAQLAVRSRMPTVYLLREHAEAGGLLTYGIDLRDSFRRAAGYVDKILRGARPGDLPIEQPTKFELVINLKTAKALRITIPASIVARADQLIE